MHFILQVNGGNDT
ncbi:MAG: hypothetical protein E7336_13120, partial [Clostridiales bacterium]|nr:hypothetical protein [Clostridiales bacterium]